jgi:hypothetical protein
VERGQVHTSDRGAFVRQSHRLCSRFSCLEKLEVLFHLFPQGGEARIPFRDDLFGLWWRVWVPLLVGVLVQHSVEVANQVVLEDDLVGEQMREEREGRGVEPGQLGAEAFIGEVVLVDSAFQVRFVLCQGRVLPVRAGLLFLQGFGASFVAFVINLIISS